jgi:sugar phosphate isomerase/epimerase
MPAPSQIAAQLYTVREHTKTSADIAKTLKRIKQIGYDAVQSSALGKIDPAELAKIFQGEGLTCAATHTPLDRLKNDTQAVLDEHRLWNCHHTAIGGHYPTEPSAEGWRAFAAEYSTVAGKFANSGLHLGYHNHSHELAHFQGKPALQTMIDHASKEIWFEIDTYWIVAGGGDPVAWLNKVQGRCPCVHLKDMVPMPDRRQHMAEVGSGNLNWPAILPACRAAGVQWYIVEQDDLYGTDPFECLATSLRNLKAMGLH